MIHSHAIYRDQTQTRGAGPGKAPVRHAVRRASTYDHREFQRDSSLPRNLGRCFGIGHFLLPTAGGCDCHRTLAKFTCAQSHLKCFSERNRRHFRASIRAVAGLVNVTDANENGLSHAQILFAPGAKTND